MSFLDLLFPKRCLGCGGFGAYLCNSCKVAQELNRQTICPICERLSPDGRTHAICSTKFTINGATFIFRYKSPISSLLKQLKYHFAKDLSDVITSWTTEELKKLYLPRRKFTVVPIPLHELRDNWRGFNQAEILGREIAKSMDWDFRNDILVRCRLRLPQTEVREARKRRLNVQNIFSVPPNNLRAQLPNILLFDDVWTTGSTMREAARTLKHAGASFVWGLTIAR